MTAPVRSRLSLAAVAPAAMIALITLAAFSPALDAEFLNWDDLDTITQNQQYRGLSLQHLQWMFTTGHMGHYQPLAWVSFAIDYSLWGMQARGYHLTSILLHAASAMLVYVVALQLLDRTTRDTAMVAGSKAQPVVHRWPLVLAAAFAALVFGIHPMRVESVVWITERRDVLSGLFAIGCVLAYINYTAAPQRHARWWYAASLVLFGLALLSKAITLTLPAILLALDWFPLRRNLRSSRVWVEKLPFIAMSAIIAVVILNIQQTLIRPVDEHPLMHRIAQAIYGFVYYPRTALWPVNLLPLYEFPTTLSPAAPRFVLSAVLIIAIAVVLSWKWRQCRGAVVAILAYAVLVGPVLGLLQTGPQFVADRYSYLSLIGIGFVLAWLVLRGLASQLVGMRVATLFFLAVSCTAMVTLTARYATHWQTSESLWRYTLDIEPSHAIAHACYGAALNQRGERAAAQEHYQAALNLRPDMPEPAINIGTALAAANRTDEAIALYDRALGFNPAHPELNRRMGDLLQRAGDQGRAIEHYERALQAGNEDMALHNNFANALAATGHFDRAIHHYRIALAKDPKRVQTYINLALNLWQHGRQRDEALQLLAQAQRIEPGNPKIQSAIDQIIRGEK